MASAVNVAVNFISYLINLCASFGWQSAHTIYCVKFIRINQRAVVHHLKNIRLLEPIKEIAVAVVINGMKLLFDYLEMEMEMEQFLVK